MAIESGELASVLPYAIALGAVCLSHLHHKLLIIDWWMNTMVDSRQRLVFYRKIGT